jgi:hypothetical protein
MQPVEASHDVMPDDRADAQASGERRTTLSRRRALAIVGGLAGVLGLGWLADALATLPPGRAPSGPRVEEAGAFTVALTLAPATPRAAAPTRITVAVHDLAGQATEPARVRGALGMPAMGMDPVDVAWQALAPGQYGASVTFPMAGAWSLMVTLTDASQHDSTARFSIAVR